MKRPVIIATVLHLLLALLLVGMAVYVLLQIRNPEIAKEPEAVHGVMIGAGVVGGPAIPLLIGAWGLWTRKRWGWWTSLLTDVLLVATLAYSMVDDNSIDMEQVVPTVCIAALVVILLLPWVRRHYARGQVQEAVSGS